MVKERQSNIELLRIITMFFIVAHHYVVNSGLYEIGSPIFNSGFTFNAFFTMITGAWGKIGINIFVLITGYFMCKSSVSLKKFYKLLFEIVFYNFLVYLFLCAINVLNFDIKQLLISLIPIKRIATDFVGCYLILYLLIPYLNILINNMSKKQHIYLITICLFVYTLYGSLAWFTYVNMNYVSWFIVIYFIGSYLRIYNDKILNNKTIINLAFVLINLITVLAVLFCVYYSIKTGKERFYSLVMDSNNVLALISSISIFLFFKSLNIKYNRFINTIASTTFGILLIHANRIEMSNWIWHILINPVVLFKAGETLAILKYTVLVFVVCSLIDLIRIKFIEKHLMKAIDRIYG